ncbi:DUF3592 domain-containing protein [Microlunatus parietis]|uniref:DUF3592 domain-containing protein n=1 Tax=Microlunatus parietis TaxID=682979 RepID=A0A7Y9I7G9_9ACTN|nr:DUF3592 domain-containing protein [Microlunatus parietis]NYE71179.1 hypothetical protein [Microlunatus parietis]
MPGLMIVTLAMTLCAIALLVVTIVVFVRTRQFLSVAVRVPGRIVGAESRLSRDRDSGRRRRLYSPIFTFLGPDGQEHRLTSTWRTSSPPALGDVTVLVPPADPGRARIDTFSSRWARTIILGCVTVPFAVVAAVLIAVSAAG